jgi:hypothetical protein
VVFHPDLPADLVIRIYLEPWAYSGSNLLRHPALRQADLTRYTSSPRWEARALVGRDPNAPAALIDRLSRDEHPTVRVWMAPDPRLSLERVLELFEDPETSAAASANPRLPVGLMEAILDAVTGGPSPSTPGL